MKKSFLQAGLIVGTLSLGLAGCKQTETTEYVKKPKSDDHDPTAWSDKDVIKGKSESGTNSDSDAMPASTGIKGTWSSEGQEIERSLGVIK